MTNLIDLSKTRREKKEATRVSEPPVSKDTKLRRALEKYGSHTGMRVVECSACGNKERRNVVRWICSKCGHKNEVNPER